MIGLDRPRLRGVVTATSLHTLDHGREARVVADNGAFRYDATLFSRDKRHLLLRRAREKEREGGLFFHKTAIDDAALNSESEHCIDAAAAAAGTDRRISQRGGGLCVHNFAPKTKNICMRVMS